MDLPVTWEGREQPRDDQNAGNVWFWAATYREFQEGLKLALERLKRFDDVARELDLQASPYDEEVERLETMIEWGEERLKSSGTSRITVAGVSYGLLRYLKAGILLRASELLNRRQHVISERSTVPKSILEAFDSRIQQLLNLAEQGALQGLRPAELFFETISPDGSQPATPVGTTPTVELRGLIGREPYSSEPPIVDSILRERCLPILSAFDEQGLTNQFDTLIREMSVILEDRVRLLSGCDGALSGTELLAAAMTGATPRIKFSDRKDLQDAAHLLFRGYSGFVRNDVMHRLSGGFTRERVFQLLGMVDYLLDLLARAEVSSKKPEES
jgi:hypothetical protein